MTMIFIHRSLTLIIILVNICTNQPKNCSDMLDLPVILLPLICLLVFLFSGTPTSACLKRRSCPTFHYTPFTPGLAFLHDVRRVRHHKTPQVCKYHDDDDIDDKDYDGDCGGDDDNGDDDDSDDDGDPLSGILFPPEKPVDCLVHIKQDVMYST